MAVSLAPWIEPEINTDGDDILIIWRPLRVAVSFTGLREDDAGRVNGEITVMTIGQNDERIGRLEWGSFGLSSLSAREGLIRSLGKRTQDAPVIDWEKAIRSACIHAVEQHRKPNPIVDLSKVTVYRDGQRFLFDRIWPLNDVGTIYGDGSSGKSLTVMLFALSYCLGRPVAGALRPVGSGEVLYLDWEANEEEHAERLESLCAGLGVQRPMMHYRAMRRKLADDVAQVRKDVDRTGAGLIIIDSMGLACGNVVDQECVIRFYEALRSIPGATKIIVTHVSADGARQERGPAAPVGLRWVNNYGRSNWEVRADRNDALGQLEVALYHRKVNGFPLQQPIGLRYKFDAAASAIHVERFDVLDNASLTAHGSASDQILGFLREQPADASSLATSLGIRQNLVRARLSGLQKAGKVEKRADGLWRVNAAVSA